MAALMISSQLLLTAFVIYWLVGQYREERTLLHAHLKKEYYQVHDQLLDSMLMQHLIIPSLDDSMQILIHEKEVREAGVWIDADTDAVSLQHFGEDLPDEIQLRTIHMDGSAPQDSGMRTLDITSVITDEERMVRSVRLFINQNQETFQSDTGMHVYALNLDSNSVM